MILLVAIFSVLFGLAFGSFLNVCITRLPKGQSIIRPGSRCPSCAQPIRARDNLPILSWILLSGRCRNCGWHISLRYPLVELATAALFLLSYLSFGLTVEGIGMAVLCFLLLGLAVMDADCLLVPNAFTLPGIALGIVYSGLRGGWRGVMLASLYAGIAASLIVLIRTIYWLVRKQEGMGLGDAKLLAMIAAWLGPISALLVLYLGVIAAAALGVLWMVLNKRARVRTLKTPFGAFLCAAAIYTIFLGRPIIQWYSRFFH